MARPSVGSGGDELGEGRDDSETEGEGNEGRLGSGEGTS